MARSDSRRSPPAPRTSWDPLAQWYDGWVGPQGSEHHRRLAIPAVIELLDLRRGERVLDLGAGQGVLAPTVLAAGATYVGVDLSPRLLTIGRRRHPGARFLLGDVARLREIKGLSAASFEAAVFLLSIQDMEPLKGVIGSASWSLSPGGRLVIFMTHPCFRVPRQSGWGWDAGRNLRYRRIDRYLKPLPVPMKAYTGRQKGVTLSFHRPLQAYVAALADSGLYIERFEELPTFASGDSAADELAGQEIPLFLAIRARKMA